MNYKFRSKLIYCAPQIWKKIYLFHKSFVFKLAEKYIFNRSNTIPLAYIGLNAFIHSGKRWHTRRINRWMVGFKFGEFTWNRKLALYKSKQMKKKKLKLLKKRK